MQYPGANSNHAVAAFGYLLIILGAVGGVAAAVAFSDVGGRGWLVGGLLGGWIFLQALFAGVLLITPLIKSWTPRSLYQEDTP